MKVGDYVKTTNGIVRIAEIKNGVMKDENDKLHYGNFIKSSPNIIDLIEEGDILKLLDVQYDKEYKAEVILDYNDNLCVIDFENNKIIDLKESLFKKDIKLLSIITKEQFENIKYEVN